MEESSKTDEDLMAAYLEGDESAFHALYQRYSGKIYAFLKRKLSRKESADDAFQGVFMKLHKSRDLYRKDLKFAPWIFTIAKSVAIDVMRSQNVHESSSSELDENSLVASDTIDQKLDVEMLSSLSGDHQEVLRLRYEEDKSFEEIARILDTNSSNVRKMVSRAVQKLREKL